VPVMPGLDAARHPTTESLGSVFRNLRHMGSNSPTEGVPDADGSSLRVGLDYACPPFMRTPTRPLFLWMLVLTMGSAACESPNRAPDASTNLMEAVPPDNLRSCQADSDCVKVPSSCNGCCEEEAVNAGSSTAYSDYKMNVCAGYAGPICNCFVQPSRVVCRQQKCTLEHTDGG
jgi:hypothetical protein